jgi:hypothetical protein
MKHYIYHIPGVKIGCTNNPERRTVKQQGATEWEVLEEHTDAKVASKREIELQKQYGYPIDKVEYWKTLKMQKRGVSESANKKRRKTISNRTPEDWIIINKKRVGKIDYSNRTMSECHTPEVIAKRSKSVNQYDLQGNFIKSWVSASEAGRFFNRPSSDIAQACRESWRTAYGFIWKYI